MRLSAIVGDTALWAEKDKDATLNYSFDLASQISDGDSIVSCDVFIVSTGTQDVPARVPVTLAGQVIAPAAVTLSLIGGDVGVWFNVTGQYLTAAGLSDQFTLRLFIKPDAQALSPMGSALFPNRYSAVLSLRKNRLAIALKGVMSLAQLDDDTLWLKLQAAESEVARKLGIFLQPTEVFSIDAPAAAVAALAGRPYVIEPGYDLPPDLFRIGNFGMLRLNHPLVSQVSAMSLRHPSLGFESFDIPPAWILVVGRTGLINVVPGSGPVNTLPISLFTLQALGAGYPIPQMIRVQYTAGLAPSSEFYPEIIDVTQRVAVMSVLADAFVAQSSSISADGLSRSMSQDVSKHQEAIDDKLSGLRDRLIGPVWGVL